MLKGISKLYNKIFKKKKNETKKDSNDFTDKYIKLVREFTSIMYGCDDANALFYLYGYRIESVRKNDFNIITTGRIFKDIKSNNVFNIFVEYHMHNNDKTKSRYMFYKSYEEFNRIVIQLKIDVEKTNNWIKSGRENYSPEYIEYLDYTMK